MAEGPTVSSAAVARLAAAAAQEAADVVALHGGALGEVATYGRGSPVRGVRVDRAPTPRVRLYTVMRFGARLDEVADEVRRRVQATLAAQVPSFADAVVDVHVADVREATDDQPQQSSLDAPASRMHELP